MKSVPPPRLKAALVYLLKISTLAVIIHLAARLGLKMAYVQFNTSPVWPPAGIALAALLLFEYDLWPGISLGVLVGSLLTGAQLSVALGSTLSNTVEALVGAYCLNRLVGFHLTIDRTRDVLGLILVSLFSTALGATLGTTTLMLTGQAYWSVFGGLWFTWWIGDLLGALVVAPLLLVWLGRITLRSSWRRLVEAGAFLILLSLVTGDVFSNQPPAGIVHQAMIYIILPFMIWAGLRLGQRGTTLAIALVSGIAIWGTVTGMGPFALTSKNDSLVLLQTFLGVVSVISLILAAATIERRTFAEALTHRVDDLAMLNDSSKAFLDNADVLGTYQTICRLAVARLGLAVAWIEAVGDENAAACPLAIYGGTPETVAECNSTWTEETTCHDPLTARVFTQRNDQPEVAAHSRATSGSRAVFPLVFSGKPIGELHLLSADRGFFTNDKLILIQSYANLAAVAIQNTWLFEDDRKSNRQLHALSQRLMQAQEEERLHLSRELHDESGQLLTALSVQLGLLERNLEQPQTLHTMICDLKQTANRIQVNLHQLAVNLRPASLDHLGLITTVKQYIHEFSRQYGLPVEFEAVGLQEQRLPLEVETALFRVIQESLTNVVLHAQASRVDVLISQQDQHVVTIVEDNGIGFLPTSPMFADHLGLFGMRERLEMLGGCLTIESSPGQGTTVKGEVPYHD